MFRALVSEWGPGSERGLSFKDVADKVSLVSAREIDSLVPDNQRQRRTCYALCHILYPVSAARISIFLMDSNSTSYCTLK